MFAELKMCHLVKLQYKALNQAEAKYKLIEDDLSIIDPYDIIEYIPEAENYNGLFIFPTDIDVKEAQSLLF